MLIAIIAGNALGAICAFFLSRWLLRVVARKTFAHEDQRKWVRWVGGLFGAISYAPSIFLAMMFGGVIGGGGDQAAAEVLGIGSSLPVLSARLALVSTLMVTVNAAMGALFGVLIARSLQHRPVI